jgi:hypothetical protein
MNIRDIETNLIEGRLHVRFHNGVGFMQAYLTDDVRLHVWHPDITVPLESFGNRHDHRFDLESHVLLGAVVDTQFVQLGGKGNFDIYTVKPAHFGETPVPVLTGSEESYAVMCPIKHSAGWMYELPKGVMHESRTEGLTVTIMRKSNQSENWARILATPQQIPEHGMARKPKQALLDQLFFSALRKLPLEANEVIHQMTQKVIK